MPSQEGSNLRPLWRIRHALNRQEVKFGGWPTKKMLINAVRSRYVYENKENNDRMSDELSDIYVDMTCVRQEFAHSEPRMTLSRRVLSGNSQRQAPRARVAPTLPFMSATLKKLEHARVKKRGPGCCVRGRSAYMKGNV